MIKEVPIIQQQRIKHFSLQREIGRGSMGVVFEALDEERNVVVALKTLSYVNALELDYFKKEFRALQNLSHPNLCHLLELFEDNGKWFIAMELVSGANFLSYTQNRHAALTGAGSARAESLYPLQHTRFTGFDEARLRGAIKGIAKGLTALHAAGKVHRDIKPNNVLVTEQGRSVLLDFGLIADLSKAHKEASDFVGTAEYMAPEQAEMSPITPAADCYSLGVMLYEALTGTLPFSGRPVQIILSKQREEAEPPSKRFRKVPTDLDALCLALLRKDPTTRPTSTEIIDCIDPSPISLIPLHKNDPPARRKTLTGETLFIGRQDELHILKEAFERTLRGKSTTLLLEGVSGVGKSALVHSFLSDVEETRPDTVILSGCCYEKESVPFKAFDGLLDELSQFLLCCDEQDVQKLLPENIALLARLFPTLNRVEAIASQPKPSHEIVDPGEMQRRAFGALRKILFRIGDIQPLILFIDDMQWSDSDSLLLMEELLKQEEPLPVLMILSARCSGKGEELVFDQNSLFPRGLIRVALAPLSKESAEQLAMACLEQSAPGKTSLSPSHIAAESGGHPLYIAELARQVAREGKDHLGHLRLDDVIWERAQHLSSPAKRILEYSCVVGTPLERSHLRDLAGIEEELFAKCVDVLRMSNFVRSRGVRKNHPIEPYHDRVREAITEQLRKQGRLVEMHWEIGRFLYHAYTEDELEQRIFEIASHWNESRNLIRSEEERLLALRINYRAGKKSRHVGAYTSALEHFHNGLEFANIDSWNTHHDDMFSLHAAAAEAAYVTENFALADSITTEALLYARSKREKAQLAEIHILTLIAQVKLFEALTEGIDIIADLGIRFPYKIKPIHVLSAFIKTKAILMGMSRKKLLRLPDSTNSRITTIKRIGTRVGSAAHAAGESSMFVYTAMWGVYLSKKYGHDYLSAPSFASWGMFNCGFVPNHHHGYEMGRLSVDLLEHFKDKSAKPITLVIWSGSVAHWKENVKATLPFILDAYNTAVEIGDLLYMGNSAKLYCIHSYYAGKNLIQLYDELVDFQKQEQVRFYDVNARNVMKHYRRAIRILFDSSEHPQELQQKEYDEANLSQAYIDHIDYHFHFNNMLLHYILGRYQSAFDSALLVEKYINKNITTYTYAIYPFYHSLVCLALFPLVERKKQKQLLARVTANQKELKKSARLCPENHLHKFRLVEAERARLQGDKLTAKSLYNKATKGALENDFVQEAAIAHELQGCFYLEQGDTTTARNALGQARKYYLEWGAMSKIEELARRFPDFFSNQPSPDSEFEPPCDPMELL